MLCPAMMRGRPDGAANGHKKYRESSALLTFEEGRAWLGGLVMAGGVVVHIAAHIVEHAANVAEVAKELLD